MRTLVALMAGLACVGAVRAGVAAPPMAAPAPVATPPLAAQERLLRLQEFYAVGKAIYDESGSDRLSDKEVDLRFKEFMKWANDTGAWMNVNMTPDATNRFTTWHMDSGTRFELAGPHPREANNKFSALKVVLPQLLENLNTLITSDPAMSKTNQH